MSGSNGLEVDITVERRDFDVEVAFNVAPGEHLVLFGPSGAGKTTVVEAVAGLVRVSRGAVWLGNRLLTSYGPPYYSLPLHERAVGLLRQEPGLFPHLSIGENIGFAKHLGSDDPPVVEVARLLGIDGLLHSSPGFLSGGQRQRVALARLMLSQHEVMLLDEPYTGLEGQLSRELTDLARMLASSVPAVMVTHDLETAQHFADRIGVMDAGRLLEVGDARNVVMKPSSRRVAELVGYRSFVATEAGVVAVHPERIRIGSYPDEGPVLAGQVSRCRPAGTAFEIELGVESSGGVVPVVVRSVVSASPGEALAVTAVEAPVFR